MNLKFHPVVYLLIISAFACGWLLKPLLQEGEKTASPVLQTRLLHAEKSTSPNDSSEIVEESVPLPEYPTGQSAAGSLSGTSQKSDLTTGQATASSVPVVPASTPDDTGGSIGRPQEFVEECHTVEPQHDLPSGVADSSSNRNEENPVEESQQLSHNDAPDKENAARPASKAMQMAETDPDAFLEMLRKRVLDDLIKERDRESCASIGKYEAFAAKIKNEETRSRAQAMLNDLRKNYGSTWHLLYPIPLSPRWHEIKGNPVAKRDFAEILEMVGVSACDREDVPGAMAPVAGLNLYGPVCYLDPLHEAVRKISNAADGGYKLKSTKATSYNRVESAGFPLDTFSYYSYDVESPQDSVNRIYFVVDNFRRVVGFQEIIESPTKTRLTMHTNRRSIYNFVQMRRKGTGVYEIAYTENDFFGASSHSRTGDVCVLTSELVDSDKKPREWVRLHLPRRLAEVCMYICEETVD